MRDNSPDNSTMANITNHVSFRVIDHTAISRFLHYNLTVHESALGECVAAWNERKASTHMMTSETSVTWKRKHPDTVHMDQE